MQASGAMFKTLQTETRKPLMIPLSLITGFLGSGKTTFLKKLVTRYRNERLVYLVNEFSPNDVDGALVAEASGDVVSIPGGSIFCKCLTGKFIHHLTTVAEQFDRPDARVKGVVIEASGIANPKVVQQMLQETRLDRLYRLESIITIVDPGSFMKLLQTLPNVRAQVEAADLVLINKVDRYSAVEVAATQQAVVALNPGVEVRQCVQCDVDVELFGSAPQRHLTGEYAKCKDPNYAHLVVAPFTPFDPQAFEQAFMAFADGLYRAKGFAQNASGTNLYVDISASGFTCTPAPAASKLELVFIVAPAVYSAVRAATATFGQVIFEAAPRL